MSFAYSAGSATPGFGGLAEFSSLRICQGTYRPLSIPPLDQTMPLRTKSSPVPRGGAFVDPPLPDAWAFDLTGFLWVPGGDPTAGDTQAAIDYLRSKVNAYQGWMTLTLNALSWPATRFMTVQVNGQVSAEDMEVERKKLPRRGFTIPLIAADPRIYSTLQTTTPITTSTAVVNAGTTPAPFTARFHGPQTDPELNGPGAGNNLQYTGTIASGHYVDVVTVDPATGTMTATSDAGVNVFAAMTIDTATYVNPGTSHWTRSNTSGAGATEMLTRDAWG